MKQLKTQTIDVIIEKDKPAGYHAYCPDLPGCHSQGDTVEEARSNIAEAMQVYLER
ncbi:type II toxin-antitoxin system HicB family antitoxin [Patescibacteria group bacterium]|nr:type II toxin-antitoxin system HicB family antitoxin [Patescibacteria group bacterium]MBU2474616.1 type II toxin-antitoxin system HicB family antitoxin [Patescibacteria group bacterium]